MKNLDVLNDFEVGIVLFSGLLGILGLVIPSPLFLGVCIFFLSAVVISAVNRVVREPEDDQH